jgi:hypothetical protein
MAKHTPGPWKSNGANQVFGGAYSGLIATVTSTANPEICEADARLIAAAPELLEALKRIAYEPQGKADASHAEVLKAVEKIAKQAIAKAEGAQ